jgi:hypothetical protein
MRKTMLFFVMVLLLIPGNGFSQQIETAFWGNKSVICDLAQKQEMIFGNSDEFLKFLTVYSNDPNKDAVLSLYVKNDGSIFLTEGDKNFFCITFVGNNMKLFRQQKSLDNKDTF